MIGYTMLGTNNLEKAVAFYDSLFSEMGIGRLMEEEGAVAWGASMNETLFFINRPYDKQSATAGNGTMVAMPAASQEQVDKLHAKALELGAANEGDPGERAASFYAAYFRDLDGNKLCFFHYDMPEA